ncbi:MAG: hypothetical protein A2046_14290 [Bacteroidetes bacterium GWA2_30_7]|nr:MAG: hypothetical protein A2046_14290 [Bacteroidetes bacterium GWA2_30_7]
MKKRLFQIILIVILISISPIIYIFIKNIQNDLALREYVAETIIPRIRKDINRFFTFDNKKDEIPIIYLEIEDENYNKLEKQRKKRLEKIESSENFVGQDNWKDIKAIIKFKEEKHNIKLRIRGDMPSNFNRGLENCSYRFDIIDESYLFGKKKLSLVRPFLENNFYSYIFSGFLENEGFISTDAHFVRLYLNGKENGIYILQEGFSKELIESSDYREGVILRFKNDCIDCNNSYNNTGFPELDAYNEKKIVKDTVLANIFARALLKMNLLKFGQISASQCFNVSKFAKYIALCDMFLAHHSLTCHNVKLYFNPVNDKFEPIAWDPSSFVRYKLNLPVQNGFNEYAGKNYNNKHSFPIYPFLFSDTIFINAFNNELYKYANDTSIMNFISMNQNLINNLDPELYRQNFQPQFNPDLILGNIKDILNNFTTDNRLTARLFYNEGILMVRSNIPLAIKITEIYMDSLTKIKLDKIIMPFQYDTIVIPKKFIRTDDKKFTLYSTIYGLDLKQKYRGRIFSKVDNSKSVLVLEYFDKSLFNINEINKTISFKLKSIELLKDIYIPSGYTFIIEEGSNIKLRNNSNIYCESTVFANGTKSKNITISSDGTGGLLIKNTSEKSEFINVVFDNLNNPEDNNWTVTGAITFYEADVKFTNCTIKNNKSEDALNIIRSNFVIDSCTINSTYSDAVDIDFGKGVIKNSSIKNTGNDALDFSGSEIKIYNVNFFDIKDKAVSSGEKSNVLVDNVSINNSYIGLASKDDSKFIAKNIEIKNSKYTVTVYQKKGEFGASSLEIENGEFEKSNFLIEEKSNFVYNYKKIIGDKKNVYDFLYKE